MTLVSSFFLPINRLGGISLVNEKIRINEISVVIPVKNNQNGVNKYLESFFVNIEPNKYPKEIIIVDNKSEKPIFIKDNFKSNGVDIILSFCNKVGPGAARNHGAKIANGKWLLFNDSDCIPLSSLFDGYILASKDDVIAYAGNVIALGTDHISKYYISQEILVPPKIYIDDRYIEPQYIITANTLINKKVFEHIGGFRESILIAGGEDIDLGLRLSKIGKLAYAFDSLVQHNFDDGIFGFLKRFIRYGRGNKIIESIWNVDMRPRPFSPNDKGFVNIIMARFQYYMLLLGYTIQKH